jgi:hypothetical protein
MADLDATKLIRLLEDLHTPDASAAEGAAAALSKHLEERPAQLLRCALDAVAGIVHQDELVKRRAWHQIIHVVRTVVELKGYALTAEDRRQAHKPLTEAMQAIIDDAALTDKLQPVVKALYQQPLQPYCECASAYPQLLCSV